MRSANVRAVSSRFAWISAVFNPVRRAISPGCGVSTSGRPLASFASRTGFAARMFNPSASITTGISMSDSNPVVNLTVSGSWPSPGPMASTVLPIANAAVFSEARFSSDIAPAALVSSPHVINSGAMALTTPIAAAGTAAVTRPAPMRNAPSAAIAGAPALPPADPNVPPTTSTCPYLPLFASTTRGARASTMADPAHLILSFETIASSGEPIGATTTGCRQPLVNCPNTCAGFGAVNVTTASDGNTGAPADRLVESAGQPEGRSTESTGALQPDNHLSASRARPF